MCRAIIKPSDNLSYYSSHPAVYHYHLIHNPHCIKIACYKEESTDKILCTSCVYLQENPRIYIYTVIHLILEDHKHNGFACFNCLVELSYSTPMYNCIDCVLTYLDLITVININNTYDFYMEYPVILIVTIEKYYSIKP